MYGNKFLLEYFFDFQEFVIWFQMELRQLIFNNLFYLYMKCKVDFRYDCLVDNIYFFLFYQYLVLKLKFI